MKMDKWKNLSLREKARREVLEGVKNGTIKFKITHQCAWCLQVFDSEKEFDAHLIEGKTVDPKPGKKRRICPN